MKNTILIVSAALLCACSGSDELQSKNESAVKSSSSQSAAKKSKPAAKPLFTHTISAMKAGNYGGNCLFEGSFTNGSETPLFTAYFNYKVSYEPRQAGASGIMGQGELNTTKMISGDSGQSDPIIKPGETRPITVTSKNIECERIKHFELKSFSCVGANAAGKRDTSLIQCNPDSLIIDNKTEMTFKR